MPDDKAPAFGTIGEIEHALHAKAISLHDKIKARFETIDAGGNPVRKIVVTTPGRMMIAQILPKHPNVPFELINRQLTKKNVSDVIDAVYRHCGQKECVIFADRLMGLGFGQAAKAGISFGKDDLIIPVEKEELISRTQAEAKEFEQQYQDGLITAGERYNKVVDAWSRCTDEVAGAMMKEISKQESGTSHQLGVDDVALRRAWVAGADAPAGRHARADGQAVRRDHRAADHRQLQGRPVRAGVLQLHPRCP